MAFTIPGLLGMNNQQPDPYQSLLGGYYTPQQAKMAWLGGSLQGLGAGLASGKSGAWAQGLALGGGEGLDNYRQRAVAASALDMRKKEYDYQQQQRQEEAAARQAEKDAQAAWLANPEDKTLFAKAYPTQYAQQYAQSLFPDPQGVSGPEYGLNPVALADETGKFIGWGQMSKTGGLFYNNTRIDGSSGIRPMDPSSLNFAKSSGAAQGTASGEATAAAPGDIAAADLALGKINDLRSDPNRPWGTGASSIFNSIPSTPGYDFQAKVDEVTAGAFLTAIQQMRGLGQLSNTEGQTAKAAVTRMKTATSEAAFLEALADYEEVVMLGKQRAQARLGNVPPGAPQAAGPTARPPSGVSSNMPDLSQMTEEQLRALANGNQ